MKKVTEFLICSTVIAISGVATGLIARGISNIKEVERRKAVI